MHCPILSFVIVFFISIITCNFTYSNPFLLLNPTVYLNCTENVSPKITWRKIHTYRGEIQKIELLQNKTNKFVLFPNGTLMILHIKSSDSGYYTCEEHNNTNLMEIINVYPEEVRFKGYPVLVDCLSNGSERHKGASYEWEAFLGFMQIKEDNHTVIFPNGSIYFMKPSPEQIITCIEVQGSTKLKMRSVTLINLKIEVDVKIVPPDTVLPNQTFSFECQSSGGDHYMTWRYLLNDEVVHNGSDNRRYEQKYNIQETSTVRCELLDNNNNVTKWREFTVQVIRDPKLLAGSCLHYSGTMCKPYLPGFYAWKVPLADSNEALRIYKETQKVRERELKTLFDKLDSAAAVNITILKDSASSIKWDDELVHTFKLCIDRLKRLICASAYPKCHWEPALSRLKSTGLPICREHCQVVLIHYCHVFWRDGYLGKFVSPKTLGFSLQKTHVKTLLTPSCDAIPKNVSRPFSCTPVDLEPDLKYNNDFSKSCYIRNRGEFYRGDAPTEISKQKCLPWMDITSDSSSVLLSPLVFPSLLSANSSCRNPGQVKGKPFCFLESDPKTLVECTEVRHCNESETTTGSAIVVKEETDLLMGMPKPVFIGLIVAVIVVIVLTVVISLIMKKRSKKRKKSKLEKDLGYTTPLMPPVGQEVQPSTNSNCLLSGAKPDIDSHLKEKLTLNKLYRNEGGSLYLDPRLEKLQYPRNLLSDIRELANCSYGEVILSKIPNLPNRNMSGKLSSDPTSNEPNGNKNNTRWVAVKVLKTDASQELQRSFMDEAAKLAGFNHQNIIKILGICTPIKPLCLLLEYMVYGDLNSFLKTYNPYLRDAKDLPVPSNDPHNDAFQGCYLEQETTFMNGHVPQNRNSRTENVQTYTKLGGKKLDKILLTQMAMGISDAMAYISINCFVHRDLATRNCLVGDHYQVKLADFSLCKPIFRQQDYKGEDNEMVPIRWLPLESIIDNLFNVDTDVWSYGIFLWELFSYGAAPYTDMTPEQVLEYLRSFHILERPQHCPLHVYQLMESCWKFERKSRPTFTYLSTKLGELLRRFNESSRENLNPV